MAVIPNLVARSGTSNDTVTLTPTMMKLLVALVVLFAVGLVCVGLLLILRSYRKKKFSSSQQFPKRSTSKISHRRHGATIAPLNIRANEKEMLVDERDEPMTPESPVPEIRITFPDEDESGEKRKSQVMVVKLSEKGAVGLEPFHDEHLPSYRKTDERLESLDLERIGGLKEKRNNGKA